MLHDGRQGVWIKGHAALVGWRFEGVSGRAFRQRANFWKAEEPFGVGLRGRRVSHELRQAGADERLVL